MTSILPTILPALPGAPMPASVVTVDASFLLLPLVLVAAITAGLVLEHARVARRGDRTRRARGARRVVSMQRAA